MGMYEKDGLGMFHGRLILLAGLGLVGFLALTTQLGRLSFQMGPGLKQEAESRLERLAWEPTVRGRILDRKGRVLAQDRPPIDIRVDYSVLSGSWAAAWSVAFAREVHAEGWRELAPTQRDALALAYEPYFDAHVERGLAQLAMVAQTSLEEIMLRIDDVENRVERIAGRFVTRRLEELRDKATARGRELGIELDERLKRQAQRPVLEQTKPHTIIPQVEDKIGFAVQALGELTGVLEAPVLDLDGKPTEALARVELPVVPGLEAGNSRDRQYPFQSVTVDIDRTTLIGPARGDGSMSVTVGGVLDSIIGRTRDSLFAEDAERRKGWLEGEVSPEERARIETERGVDRGRYLEGDHVGSSGVESRMEHVLRGLRGVRIRRLDTGAQEVIEADHGRDVTLTIDAKLQARIAAALSPEVGLAVSQEWHGSFDTRRDTGQPLSGAAVVIDIETGEVLVLVSTPTIDPDDPTQSLTQPEGVAEHDWANPTINRATSAIYPPGSIAKAMTLTWAASRGEQQLGERIACDGHFLPGRPDILRCWIWRERFGMATHSTQLEVDPDEAQALTCSCNIYFYELGRRLGPERMLEAYRAFGAGQVPLSAVPSTPVIIGPGGEEVRLTSTDAAMLGIGQGPVAWSPLHAADAYATLARGGVRLGPVVMRGDAPPRSEDIGLDPISVERALEGLRGSVNDRRFGTGNHTVINGVFEPYFTVEGVDIWGKTGTAQQTATLTKGLRVPPAGFTLTPGQPDPPGTTTEFTPVKTRYTHAWFVGLVGPKGEPPRNSISVMMEFAGSGGRVSAPIANQIIHALQREGYLTDGTVDASGEL